MSRKSARRWSCYLLVLSMAVTVLFGRSYSAWGASDKELVTVSWGGRYTEAETKAFFDPFEKETGVKIVPVTALGDRWAKARLQVESGNVEWDLISGVNQEKMVRYQDLLEKIDYSIVVNTENLISGAVNEYGTGHNQESVNMAYNRNAFAESHPTTWAEFWDVKKFPGPRTFPNWGGSWFQPIAFALLADGVSREALIPFDYDRAFKKLDELKPHVGVWWTSGSQFQQVLRDEEVVLGAGWDMRIVDLGKKGFPIGMEWNQGHCYVTYWCVLKGTKKKDLAMQFINSTLLPERQLVFTRVIGASPSNEKTFELLTDDEKAIRGSYPPNREKMFAFSPEEWSYIEKNVKDMQERWEKWIAE